ncbi:proline-rich protein 2-like [Pseudopipra pipra]|uniref:proline-rich protein 2-like n=1 Tax=Pseudopipra pipra TaxID=415032 RepID=UPI003138B2D1
MAPQITVPPEQPRPGAAGDGRGGPGAGASTVRPPLPPPHHRPRGRAPLAPEQTAPGGRAGGLRPSPGSPNVPDAWQPLRALPIHPPLPSEPPLEKGRPAPLGTAPPPSQRGCSPPHRAPGKAARTAPHRLAPRRPRPPLGAEDRPGLGKLSSAPPRPNGAAPAAPGPRIPGRDPPHRFGEGAGGLPPRRGCALPAALPAPPGAPCRAGGARPHCSRPLALLREKVPRPRAAPRRRPQPVRKSPRHVCAPSPVASAAPPGPSAGPEARGGPQASGGPFLYGTQPSFPLGEQSHEAGGGWRTASRPLRCRRSPPAGQRPQLCRSMREGSGDVPGAAGARRGVTGGGEVHSLP